MTMLLQQGVTAQAQARPETTALAFKNTRLEYGELEEASNRLAHLLREAGCRRGDRVGLLMPKMPMANIGRKVTLVPMTISQKCSLPMPSRRKTPVTFGNQK